MEVKRCANCMEEITDSVCPYCGYREDGTVQMEYGLKRNTILHGKYLIGNVLGQGGFGITYIGFDMALNVKVAVKEYYPMGYVSRDYTQSSRIIWYSSREGQEQMKKGCEGFLKEARRMAKIDMLPEIVRVRDTFMDNNTSYIVMDYVEGETFKARLVKYGVMGLTECVDMLLPLMKSLGEVHKRGLIHRDISPDNIMLTPDGKIRLLDLGAAKDLTLDQGGIQQPAEKPRPGVIEQAKTSQLVTKKGFSPSEQYLEGGKIGTWTDVYALCATIYYCITGRLVPDALERLMDSDKLSFDVQTKEPLTEEVKGILQKGLAVKPDDRIRTVEELSECLEKAISAMPDNDKEDKNEINEINGKNETAAKNENDENSGHDENNGNKKPVKKIVIGAVAAAAVLFLAVKIFSSSSGSSDDSVEQADNSRVVTTVTTETTVPVETESETSQADTDAASEQNEPEAFRQNVLMEDEISKEVCDEEVADRWVLGKQGLARESIVTVTFLDTQDDMPEDAWDVSGAKNGSVMAWTKPADKTPDGRDGHDLYIAAEGGIAAGPCNTLFACYENMTEINFNHSFHTDQTTNMYRMFFKCKSLKSLDVSEFDISQVTNISSMFNQCSSLSELDMSGFDTSQVTTMHSMFYKCSSLKNIDVSGFDTSQVKSLSTMFYECSSLKNIDVSGFDTSQVTNMEYLFGKCSSLNELDVSGFDTSNVTNMESMFYDCSSIKELRVEGFNTSNVTNMSHMFNRCHNLESINVSNFNTSKVTLMTSMFNKCYVLTELDLSNFITSRVTDMGYMFFECSALRELDLSAFDTSQVTTMEAMFYNCSSLGTVDLSSFDTGKVTNMKYMFMGCTNLKSLDLSKFNMGSVTEREKMFDNMNITEKETGLKQ